MSIIEKGMRADLFRKRLLNKNILQHYGGMYNAKDCVIQYSPITITSRQQWDNIILYTKLYLLENDVSQNSITYLTYTGSNNPTAAQIQTFVTTSGYTDKTQYRNIRVRIGTTTKVWRYNALVSISGTWVFKNTLTTNSFDISTSYAISDGGRVFLISREYSSNPTNDIMTYYDGFSQSPNIVYENGSWRKNSYKTCFFDTSAPMNRVYYIDNIGLARLIENTDTQGTYEDLGTWYDDGIGLQYVSAAYDANITTYYIKSVDGDIEELELSSNKCLGVSSESLSWFSVPHFSIGRSVNVNSTSAEPYSIRIFDTLNYLALHSQLCNSYESGANLGLSGTVTVDSTEYTYFNFCKIDGVFDRDSKILSVYIRVGTIDNHLQYYYKEISLPNEDSFTDINFSRHSSNIFVLEL